VLMQHYRYVFSWNSHENKLTPAPKVYLLSL